jgi:hypothetical protein
LSPREWPIIQSRSGSSSSGQRVSRVKIERRVVSRSAQLVLRRMKKAGANTGPCVIEFVLD